MPLVIEDGTGKADANSYVALSAIRAYATSNGYELPEADADLEVMSHKSVAFLESLRASYAGTKATKAQSMQWPRTGAVVDGFDVADNEIPAELVKAQCQLVCEVAVGNDPMPNSDGKEVIRKKIDVIETEYSPGSGSASPNLARVTALLEPLLSSGQSSSFQIPVTRA